MIIGADAKRILRNTTGLGSYSRTLVNDLANVMSADDRLLLYAPDKGYDELRRQVTVAPAIDYRYPGGALKRILWRSHRMVDDLRRDGVQIYHGLSGELPVGIRRAGIRSVVTIHDLIFLRHPEYYNKIDVLLYKLKFHLTLREADRIIAISECTKRDIMHFGHVEPDRIDVIYQACSTRYRQQATQQMLDTVRQRYSLPERYILNVGTVEERKNIMLAAKALTLLPSDIALVIVGRQTDYCRQVGDYAHSHGISNRIVFLHNVGNQDLPALYQMAQVFVYPSRYEGFGIPIIEAIQSGLPVVACTGSCLEEAGGPNCLYVSPDDHSAMAHAINTLLGDDRERNRRIQASRHYIERFEGNDVARQVYDTYHSILDSQG